MIHAIIHVKILKKGAQDSHAANMKEGSKTEMHLLFQGPERENCWSL